jgi:hypothetical protein
MLKSGFVPITKPFLGVDGIVISELLKINTLVPVMVTDLMVVVINVILAVKKFAWKNHQ